MSHTRNHQDGEPPDVSEAVCHGIVVGVRGKNVLVELDSNAECSACASKTSCTLAAQTGKQLEIEARGFVQGERVAVHTGQGVLLKVSVVLYVIPVLLIITGSFAGALAIPEFLGWSTDVGSLVGVVTGIVVSWLFVYFYRTGQAGQASRIWLEKVEDDG